MRRILSYTLGGLMAANGLFMLAAPAAWYAVTPGVPDTGPLNGHFVRDIGAAYLVMGAALVWYAARPAVRPAAWAAAAFLGLHALVHLADAIFGREAWSGLARDIPAIFLPAALALWLAWAPSKPGETS